MRGHGIGPAALRYRQRERLQAVILKHQRRHGIGHPGEQHIAFRHGQRTRRDFGIQRDLDVDFMIRTVDACRVVDEIGVDPPAAQAKGDARGLGNPQVRSFADDSGADVFGIDAQAVIGGIADRSVRFARGLHISTDAAEPDQVDRAFQDRGDERGRVEVGGVDAKHGACLFRQFDRFVSARKDAAAFGNQAGVIIGP